MIGRKYLLIPAAVGGLAILAAASWTMSSAGSGARPPIKARRAPPQPVKTPTLPEAEAEHLFRSVLLRLQQEYLARRPGCGTRDSWLAEDRRSERPLARLFARACPELCKRMILEILQDPEAPDLDRRFALLVLQSLPDWTSVELEELLRDMVVRADDDHQSYLPLLALGHRDREMRHRDLYQAECRKGNDAAFEILSRSVHSTSVALFQELAKESRERYYPLGHIPDFAELALEKLRILQGKDWQAAIEKCITTPSKNHWAIDYFFWACDIAKQRKLPGYLDWLAARARGGLKEVAVDGENLDDHALAIFAEEGGELTPDEFGRLRENGFVGDPEELLLQLLAQRRIR